MHDERTIVTVTQQDDLKARVLAQVLEGFPVSVAPYCDLGVTLGESEIDVLAAVIELRECGRISRLAAEFADLEGFTATASQEDADLAMLVGVDLPSGEHPFEEIAAQLQLRGIDASAEWVVARVLGWMLDGTVVRVAAESA